MHRSISARPILMCTALVIALSLSTASAQEVIVMSSIDELVAWLQAESWW